MKAFFLALIASIGGAFVSIGLWLENEGEKDSYKDIKDFRLSKKRAHCGLKFVFWGVVLETALGFGVAMWEGWQAIESDPLNKPVASATAFLTLQLPGNVDTTHKISITPPQIAHLDIGEFTTNEFISFLSLVSDDFDKFIFNDDLAECRMEFRWDKHLRGMWSKPAEMPIGEFSKTFKSAILSVFFLPMESEIIGGTGELTINGSIKYKFTIPKQRTQGGTIRVNFNDHNPK